MSEPLEQPRFRSAALDRIHRPDFTDVQIVALPAGADPDPRVWADRILGPGGSPAWVVALMGLRQALVGLVGIPKGSQHAFDVDCVVGQEALIDTDDRHLRFCCGVAVDSERSLLRVTTVVRLKGWRGRLYFAPVAVLHGPIVRAMMRRAVQMAR